MYRTLGCYHSLQPTRSPFDTPCIPCLTPHGYARWQTIQLMLSPQEHVPFLQKAVQIYDVPRADGGYFPKNLPRECLPDRPDAEMEKWYRFVTGSLNQDNYMRRIKYSPTQSPYPEPQDRRDSYFLNGQSTPNKATRTDSYTDEQARLAAYRRRSSVPDIVSPGPGAERGSHWDPNTPQERKARSHSATRSPGHHRQRSHTTTATDHHHRPPESPAASKRYGSTPDGSRPTSSRPSSRQYPQTRPPGRRPKSPSTVDEDTGSEGSSESSQTGHHRRLRRSDEERPSRTSLWVPSFLRPSHKRRHSSEGRVRSIEGPKEDPKPPLPLRPEYYTSKRQHFTPPIVPQTHAPPVMPPAQRPPPQGGVRFRSDMFDDAMHSAPESPATNPPPAANGVPPPSIRYPEPMSPNAGYPVQQLEDMSMLGQTASRESSGGSGNDRRYHSGSDWDRNARKTGQPVRVTTVTGVHGRAYPEPPPAERQGATRPRGSVPTVV
jgi:hypothetical protein